MAEPESIELVKNLLSEADDGRREFAEAGAEGHRLYRGDHWKTTPPEGIEHYTMNLIKRSVDSLTAVLLERRPITRVVPTESNAPSIFYLDRSIGEAIAANARAAGIDLPGLTPGQLSGDSPLSEEDVAALGPLLQDVPPEKLVAVNDDTVAKYLQTGLRVVWDWSSFDLSVSSAVKNELIAGWQPIVVDWDPVRSVPIWRVPHFLNFWVDPNAHEGHVDEAEYVIEAELVSLRKAKKLYPDGAKVWERNQFEGNLVEGVSGQVRIGGSYKEIRYRRAMVLLMRTWIREGDKIRLIVSAGTTEVGYETTFKGDIPAAMLLNIPAPHRAYGWGEPRILESPQKLINRMLSIFGNHTRYFQNPQMIMPASMKLAMGQNGQNLYSHPGNAWVIPDDVLVALGSRFRLFVDPPSLNDSYMTFFGKTLTEFSSLSLNVDVLQGNLPSSDASGRAIAQLQNASRGAIGLRAIWLENALSRLSKLTLQMMVEKMGEAQWAKMIDKLPTAVLKAIRSRAKNLTYDVMAEVVTGRGANKRETQDRDLQLFQLNALDVQTLLESMEIPQAEKVVQRLQEQAQAQTALPDVQQPPQAQ